MRESTNNFVTKKNIKIWKRTIFKRLSTGTHSRCELTSLQPCLTRYRNLAMYRRIVEEYESENGI